MTTFSARTMARRRAARRWLSFVLLAVVPLASAGLFMGAVSSVDRAGEKVPAALVNSDTLIYQTAADGTQSPVFAGRQLVTELTGDASFDWVLTNEDAAEKALAAGEVYAVVTVPSNFSESILSLSGDTPTQALIDIRTDDAHGYLVGSLAEAAGSSLASAFGSAITEQYIAGIYSGISELGTSLGTAADGAGELGSGASELAGGLNQLAAGAESARGGAAGLADGVSKYTAGADALASGLGQLRSGAAGLNQLSGGVSQYVAGVNQFASGVLAQVKQGLQYDPTNVELLTQKAQLEGLIAGGSSLNSQVGPAISGVQGGIASSADGASRLSAGSAGLRSGAASLAEGVGGLTTGATSAAEGAAQLATGAGQLADGLRAGAAQVPAVDADKQKETAEIAADPVGVSITRDHHIEKTSQALSSLFVPLGLWLGALAFIVLLRPLGARALASTASTRRLLSMTLARGTALALVQASLLTLVLHTWVGVSWAHFAATFGFSVLIALAFTAIHGLLAASLGRGGVVASLLLFALQLSAVGGIFPIEALAEPFQLVSPLLPLTHAVAGMQTIIAGGAAAPIMSAAVVLAGYGLAAVLLTYVSLTRTRRVATALAAAGGGFA